MTLQEALEDKAYEIGIIFEEGILNWAFQNGYYTRESIMDSEGYEVDYRYIVTQKDLQEVSDTLGLDVDCISW